MNDQVAKLSAMLADTYEIEREVGSGGTSIVYVAQDLKHQRRVALKVLRPELTATLAADRFLLEIRIAARLNHPHILPLHDSGRAGEFIYYVTPFHEDETLRARLEREKRIPLAAVVTIARDIGSALSHSHARQVIHRDIKPENILLSGGEAIVADFGIAHALQEAGDIRITQTGWAVGTKRYIAPEQALGEIDARADLYSLGCVMYEMLSGEPPARVITPSRPAAIRRLKVGRTNSLPPLPSDVPRRLAAIISRLLEPDPEQRFASADELLEALSALSRSSSDGLRWPAARPRWAAAVLFIAGLVGAGALYARMNRPPRVAPGGVVVFPFMVRGSVDTTLVSPETLMELISARLTGDIGPRGIDPQIVRRHLNRTGGYELQVPEDRRIAIGRSVGASAAIVGEAVGTNQVLTITGRWYSMGRSSTPAEVTVVGRPDNIVGIVDKLVAELLLRRANVPMHRLDSLMTRQPAALRLYLTGLESYRRGEYVDASKQFSEALRLDSTFALAALQLSSSLGMVGDAGYGDRIAFAVAWKQRHHLPPRDQEFLNLRAGPRYPATSPVSEELVAWSKVVVDTSRAIPGRWEARWFYGDLLFHHGPRVGNADAHLLARNLFERALETDSTLAPALEHVVELSILAQDSARALSAAARYFSADSTADDVPYMRWLVSAAFDQADGVRQTRLALPRVSQPTLLRISSAAQLIPLDMETGFSAAQQIVRNAGEPLELYTARMNLRELLLNQGRPAQAERLGPGPHDDVVVRASFEPFFRVVNALYWDADSASAARAVTARLPTARASVARPDSVRVGPMWDVCALGLWELRQDSLRRIEDWIRTLNSFPRPFQGSRALVPVCAATLRAELAHRRRLPTEMRELERLDSLVAMDWSTNAYIHLASTKTLETLFLARGDTARALTAVRRRTYIQGSVGITGLSTLLLAEGRLALATHDTSGALKAFNHYLTLRSDPEPRLIPQRDSVRTIVTRLNSRRR